MPSNFSGTQTGLYREDIDLIPIVVRAPQDERATIENLRELFVFSPSAGREIPLLQVINGVEIGWENARVSRWQRRSMITLHCDARTDLPSQLLERIKPKIEKALNVDFETYLGKAPQEFNAGTIPIKYDDIVPLKGMPGYFLSWGGEAEDSADAVVQLAASIPI